MTTSKCPAACSRASLSRFSRPILVARSISTPDRSRSAGSSHRLSMAMSLGGPRLRSGLWSFQAARIASVRFSGPRRHSLRVTGAPSTPPLNNSFIDGPSDFLSMPKVVATFPLGSRSTSRTLRPETPIWSLPTARAEARLTAVVVLAQPPLWLTTAITTGADMSLTGGKPRDYRESCESLDDRDGHFGQYLASDVPPGDAANLRFWLEEDPVADDLECDVLDVVRDDVVATVDCR